MEHPYKVIELYGTLLEIEWILMIHNNCIFLYYGYSIEIVWVYCGFSGSIVNFIAWISHFFPSVKEYENYIVERKNALLGRVFSFENSYRETIQTDILLHVSNKCVT